MEKFAPRGQIRIEKDLFASEIYSSISRIFIFKDFAV